MLKYLKRILKLDQPQPPNWVKVLVIPYVLWAGFLGVVSWIEYGLKNNWPDQGREGNSSFRHRHFGGWWGPKMQEHWARWWKDPLDNHDAKNLGSEFVRNDAQRAYKYGSAVIVVQWFIIIVLGVVVILLLT